MTSMIGRQRTTVETGRREHQGLDKRKQGNRDKTKNGDTVQTSYN